MWSLRSQFLVWPSIMRDHVKSLTILISFSKQMVSPLTYREGENIGVNDEGLISIYVPKLSDAKQYFANFVPIRGFHGPRAKHVIM